MQGEAPYAYISKQECYNYEGPEGSDFAPYGNEEEGYTIYHLMDDSGEARAEVRRVVIDNTNTS
jgi:hypothetical protein